ncbi:MAG: hypothetical protein IKT46_09710 [Clostridia bacterium]|nr:hypothetical protein [Clostridia bacterium]
MMKRRICFFILCAILALVVFTSCGIIKKTSADKLEDTQPVSEETEDITAETETADDTTLAVTFTEPNESETTAPYTETTPKETKPKETAPKVTETETVIYDDTEDSNTSSAEMVPVLSVSDALEDIYTDPQKYELCLHSDSEYARDVIVTTTAEVKNFKFFTYDLTKYMNDNVCEIEEVLYTLDSLTVQKPFAARIWIPEFISSYGISYVDNNGSTVKFMFCESGLDGSVHLVPFN